MKFKFILPAATSLIFLLVPSIVYSACNALGTAGQTTISSNCNDASWSGASDVGINGGVTISSSSQMGIQTTASPLGTLTNNGTISSSVDTAIYLNQPSVSGIINTATGNITSSGGAAITIEGGGNLGALTNSGTINTTNTSIYYGSGVAVGWFGGTLGSISTLDNQYGGTISARERGIAVWGGSSITNLINSGTISSTNLYGISNVGGTISNLTNNASGSISSSANTGSTAAIYNTNSGSNTGLITNLTNNGTISASHDYGIYNDGGVITTITNNASATISGVIAGIYNNAAATINVVNNYGTITGGILNTGTIGTVNNAQSGLNFINSVPGSKLSNNYNIIVNSTSSYGTANFNSMNGTTIFGVSSQSTLSAHNYTQVLTNAQSSNIGNINSNNKVSGTLGQYSWLLQLQSGSSSIWDLLVTFNGSSGPSLADTQTSLQNTATALQSTYALQNSVVANSLNYDCQVFDKNNVCVSVGGRNTNVQAGGVNNVSALLIAAYRAMPEVRVGGYLDQNLSVTAAGSPVNLGVNGPLVGLFAVWNENQDGTGTEVKVSGAYGQKNTTITRTVVGTSEAGVGSSSLTNTGVQAIAKYGFGVTRDAIVSPYIGIRYAQGNMGGYTEATSPTVTAPLTYSALNTNATTLMAGVHGKYRVVPEAVVQASVGLESDTGVNNGTLTATGLNGLTAVNFNPTPVKTRPVAMLGAYYDIEKTQRVGVTGIWRQEPFQAVGSATVMATYTVGL